jgi:hypothetical protein
MVLEKPYDLDVQRITPDRYKETQTVVTTVWVGNSHPTVFIERITVLCYDII